MAAKANRTSKRRARAADRKPIVIVTGAAGNLGRSLEMALRADYQVVGLDLRSENSDFPIISVDLTSESAVELAFRKFRDSFGTKIASVIHLAAYFDFSGEESNLYESVNVEGTRKLLRAMRDFEVGQFIYSSTMLVHAPCRPGERIDEIQPIEPRWAYPRSKAAAEKVVRAEHGAIPYVVLRLAGVYDEHTMVPTLSQQIARIFERDAQSHFYSGSILVGQAMLHREDMIDAFRRAVDRRDVLPAETELLIGEPDAVSYDALQDEIGRLLHGAHEWTTLRLPKVIATAGSWAQHRFEPVIPDMIDKGDSYGPLQSPRKDLVDGALFGSGRPLVLVPQGVGEFASDRIVIAWDATRPAVRAVHDALPLLVRARDVTVVSVVDDKTTSTPGTGVALCRHLVQWNVASSFVAINRKELVVGMALLTYARKAEANLLVMGGFAHGFERELMLGSATRDVYRANLEIPVLLSH